MPTVQASRATKANTKSSRHTEAPAEREEAATRGVATHKKELESHSEVRAAELRLREKTTKAIATPSPLAIL